MNGNFEKNKITVLKFLAAIIFVIFCVGTDVNSASAATITPENEEILKSLLDGNYGDVKAKIDAVIAEDEQDAVTRYLSSFLMSLLYGENFDPIKAIESLDGETNRGNTDDFGFYFSILDVAIRNADLIKESGAFIYVEKAIKILNKKNNNYTNAEKYLLAMANLFFVVDEEIALSYFDVGEGAFSSDLLMFPDLGFLVSIKLSNDFKTAKGLTYRENLAKMIRKILWAGAKRGFPPSMGFFGALWLEGKNSPLEVGHILLGQASLSGDEFSQKYLDTHDLTSLANKKQEISYKVHLYTNFKEEIQYCNVKKFKKSRDRSDCVLKSPFYDLLCRYEYFESVLGVTNFRKTGMYQNCRLFLTNTK